jgi:hypothetical protein
MPANSDFRQLQYGPRLKGNSDRDDLSIASGIAFSGGYIYNSISAEGLDAVEFESELSDVCLSHATPIGGFHYHYWTACTLAGKGPASKTKSAPLCKDSSNCLSDPSSFTKKITTSG